MSKKKYPSFTLGNFEVRAHSSIEYHTLKQEIFTNNVYYFETDEHNPFIIDCGANIGMSVLYFKKLYPNAHITAIEPLPQNLELLETNVTYNRLTNIEIIPAALNSTFDDTHIYFDNSGQEWFSTASIHDGAWNGLQQSDALAVKSVPLSSLLKTKVQVDFLKMDIEGMEHVVLQEAKAHLHKIKHFILEFHPRANHDLNTLTALLNQDFTLTFWQDDHEIKKPKHPKRLLLIEGFSR